MTDQWLPFKEEAESDHFSIGGTIYNAADSTDARAGAKNNSGRYEWQDGNFNL